jgi:rhomboid protease GluP
MPRATLCPRCRQLIGSEETVCSWCGTARSAPLWKILNWTKGTVASDSIITAIITLNIIYYAISIMIVPPVGLLSPSQYSMMLLGATGTIPVNSFGNYWSLLTANYLHGGIIHLLFNLMALRQIGPLAINEYGAARMVTIYTLGGVFGFLVSCLAGVSFTIGASAAVCSLVGALLFYGKSRGGAYGSAIYSELSGWVISIFIFGLIFPGINNWGHGGGLVGGILLGMILGYGEKRRETAVHRVLAALSVAATVIALVLALARALSG